MTLDPITPRRRPDRRLNGSRRLGLEALETRNLLTTGLDAAALVAPLPASPVPAELSTAASSASNATYDSIIGAAFVRTTYGVDGAGLTAAVIDTGVNYRNAALGGSLGVDAKVIVGKDYGDNDADPDASTWQHGTHVAGLIASSNPAAPGVAPGADIAALKVFSSSNQGSYDWIAQSLKWVLDNATKYNISVVNISLTDGGNYTSNPFLFSGGVTSQIKSLVHQLRLADIPVVCASGNSFSGQQGMGYTAILPETISVTATNGSDQVLSDAQRLGSSQGGTYATDLAAPGYNLAAPADGQSTLNVTGTSFAAPLVSGSIILLQSIYKQRFGTLPSVDQLEGWLRDGADKITDGTTGISLARLDVAGSAALIPGATPVTPAPEEPAPGPVVVPTAPPSSETTAPPSSGSSDSSASAPSQPATPPADSATPDTPTTTPTTPTTESPAAPPIAETPVTSTPSTPTTTTPTSPSTVDDALTDLYANGDSLGKVASDSSANPLAGASAAFGAKIRFTKVESWSAASKSDTSTATTATPVTAASRVAARAAVLSDLSVATTTSDNRSRWNRLAARLRRR
jgi:type VI secretion system secreted protein VgrG